MTSYCEKHKNILTSVFDTHGPAAIASLVDGSFLDAALSEEMVTLIIARMKRREVALIHLSGCAKVLTSLCAKVAPSKKKMNVDFLCTTSHYKQLYRLLVDYPKLLITDSQVHSLVTTYLSGRVREKQTETYLIWLDTRVNGEDTQKVARKIKRHRSK